MKDDATTNASPDQWTQAQRQACELATLLRGLQSSYTVIVPVDNLTGGPKTLPDRQLDLVLNSCAKGNQDFADKLLSAFRQSSSKDGKAELLLQSIHSEVRSLQDKLHTLVRQRFEDGKLDQA
jgi:hypothetical protein